MIPINWAAFKAYVNAKGLSIQYADEGDFYFLLAVDGGVIFSCKLSKNLPGYSSDVSDFETNFKTAGNGSINHITQSDRVGTGTLTALNSTIVAETRGMGTVNFHVTGTWVGTVTAQVSTDGGVTYGSAVATGGGQAVFASSTSNDTFKVACAGYTHTRLIMSAYTSGTAQVDWDAGQGVGPTQVWNTNATSLKVAPRSDNINSTGSAGSLNADLIAAIDVGGYQSVEVQITGSWVGTITFQGSDDNSTFFSVNASDTSSPLRGPVVSTAANGMFYVPLTFRYFRCRMTAYTSGTANGAHTFDTMTPTDLQARNMNITDGTNTVGVTANSEMKIQYQNSFTRVTGNATNTAKSGAGTLHGIILGANDTGGTVTIYDNTAGSGTVIMKLFIGSPSGGLLSTSGDPGSRFIGPLGINFSTGLTAVTAGASANDITLVYK